LASARLTEFWFAAQERKWFEEGDVAPDVSFNVHVSSECTKYSLGRQLVSHMCGAVLLMEATRTSNLKPQKLPEKTSDADPTMMTIASKMRFLSLLYYVHFGQMIQQGHNSSKHDVGSKEAD
jgi:hypothetical protein